LGEGKILDGCITCPWHGYQYLPHNGQSPPPFTEKVSTYDVKVEEGNVWLNPEPFAEGTERPGAAIN
jgi:nitrite reductase/ring-hydroxylating ferredoxin subunit